jgi:hypothetical protein
MKKKEFLNYLNAVLQDVPDDANIIIDAGSHSITHFGGFDVEVVCGKIQAFMPYYCVREPNHEGLCYCPCKSVNFVPDTEEQIKELYDSINK